jgi:uncharacterized membrane protein YhaH (DUF805 family)
MPAVNTALTQKYATFSGRAARSELWWFALFSVMVCIVLNIIDGAIFGTATNGIGILGLVWALAVIVPSIAVAVRRLHDLDKSGWWYLLIFIPLIGVLVLIYFFVQRGTAGAKQFGADPLAGQPVTA